MPFGLVISFQEIHAGFLLPSLLPHQNFTRREFIYKQSPLGSLKHGIEYVGSACAIDLIKTSLSPADKICSIQPWIFFQILSLRYLKAPFLDLPTSEGIQDISHSKTHYAHLEQL
jgi:hypothetical protein